MKPYMKVKKTKWPGGDYIKRMFKIDPDARTVHGTMLTNIRSKTDRVTVKVTCHEGDTFDPLVGMAICELKLSLRFTLRAEGVDGGPESSYPLSWSKYKEWAHFRPEPKKKKTEPTEKDNKWAFIREYEKLCNQQFLYPKVHYVPAEYGKTVCGREIKNDTLIATDLNRVTCQLCIRSNFFYSEFRAKIEKRVNRK